MVAGSSPVTHPKSKPRDPKHHRVSPQVGGEMNAKRFLVSSVLFLALSLAVASTAKAVSLENRSPGEISLLVGLSVADEELVGANTGPDTSPLFGLRWAAKLSPRASDCGSTRFFGF